jgi:hypothetical protein
MIVVTNQYLGEEDGKNNIIGDDVFPVAFLSKR